MNDDIAYDDGYDSGVKFGRDEGYAGGHDDGVVEGDRRGYIRGMEAALNAIELELRCTK